jgi:hypothetical protein
LGNFGIGKLGNFSRAGTDLFNVMFELMRFHNFPIPQFQNSAEYYLIMNSEKVVVGLIGKGNTKVPNELILAKKDEKYKGKTLKDISDEDGALTSVNDGSTKSTVAAAIFINQELDFSDKTLGYWNLSKSVERL